MNEWILTYVCRPDSSVGIATGYGLDGPGIESRWGEIFRTCQDRPWGPPSLLYNGYRVFPGGRKRRGRGVDHSHPSSVEVMEESNYISTHTLGHTGPVTGLLYLYLTDLHIRHCNEMLLSTSITYNNTFFEHFHVTNSIHVSVLINHLKSNFFVKPLPAECIPSFAKTDERKPRHRKIAARYSVIGINWLFITNKCTWC
jgi:hypothetical protein